MRLYVEGFATIKKMSALTTEIRNFFSCFLPAHPHPQSLKNMLFFLPEHPQVPMASYLTLRKIWWVI